MLCHCTAMCLCGVSGWEWCVSGVMSQHTDTLVTAPRLTEPHCQWSPHIRPVARSPYTLTHNITLEFSNIDIHDTWPMLLLSLLLRLLLNWIRFQFLLIEAGTNWSVEPRHHIAIDPICSATQHLGESVTQTQRLKIRYFWNFIFCHLNIVRV